MLTANEKAIEAPTSRKIPSLLPRILTAQARTDHAEAECREQREGDPVVPRRDGTEQPSPHQRPHERHERLEQAEVEGQTKRLPRRTIAKPEGRPHREGVRSQG